MNLPWPLHPRKNVRKTSDFLYSEGSVLTPPTPFAVGSFGPSFRPAGDDGRPVHLPNCVLSLSTEWPYHFSDLYKKMLKRRKTDL